MGISKRPRRFWLLSVALVATGCQSTAHPPFIGLPAGAGQAPTSPGYELESGSSSGGTTTPAGITIADGPGNQTHSATAFDSRTNRYLVVWQDDSVGSGDIYGRLTTADGTPIGARFVIANGPNPQFHPRVAYNSQSDEFLVTWTDFPGIDARRVSSAGVPIGAPFLVSLLERQHSDLSAVAYDVKANEYLVVWNAEVGLGPTISARRVSALGQNMGPIVDLSALGAANGAPSVAYGVRSDEYMITWSNVGNAILAQRFTPPNGTVGSPFVVDDTAGTTKNEPTVAYDFHHDDFLFAWSDSRGLLPPGSPFGPNFDIFDRRVAPSGTPLGVTTFAAGETDTVDDQPALAYSCPEDRFELVWRQSAFKIQALVVKDVALDTLGRPAGTPGIVFGPGGAPNDQENPAIASNCNAPGFLATLDNFRFFTRPQNDDIVGNILP
ncbi:MAG TPA: hypothetical protein V6D47_05035 [Oscillatoriaceae cyanobacterium]